MSRLISRVFRWVLGFDWADEELAARAVSDTREGFEERLDSMDRVVYILDNLMVSKLANVV